MTSDVEVTQADREAAAPFANCLSDMQDIFNGKADGLPVVQAFARHRISHSLHRRAANPMHDQSPKQYGKMGCNGLDDDYES